MSSFYFDKSKRLGTENPSYNLIKSYFYRVAFQHCVDAYQGLNSNRSGEINLGGEYVWAYEDLIGICVHPWEQLMLEVMVVKAVARRRFIKYPEFESYHLEKAKTLLDLYSLDKLYSGMESRELNSFKSDLSLLELL